MRFWIVLMTMFSLLSLPFSGSMADDSVHHSSTMQSTPSHDHTGPEAMAEDSEHCPESDERLEDCCYETAGGVECTNCPPDCGHCVMSDHGSSATLTVQQTFSSPVVLAPVITQTSFYQLLSGQPTPPPIIS